MRVEVAVLGCPSGRNEPSGFRGRKELLNRASAFTVSHNSQLSLICQLTSEDIKRHHFIITHHRQLLDLSDSVIGIR